ncbi:MAG: SEC-C metal-binding domain-containing protein [Bdellovibrionota bacterium]
MSKSDSELPPSFEELSNDINGFNAIASIYPYYAFVIDGATEGDVGTNPAKLELAIFHLLKEPLADSQKFADPWQVQQIMSAIDHDFYSRFNPAKDFDPQSPPTPLDHIAKKAQMDFEFIRGSAYPFQTETKIRETMGKFDAYYTSKLGISATKAVDIVNAVVEVSQEKANIFLKNARSEADKFVEEWRNKPVDYLADKDAASGFGMSLAFAMLGPEELPVQFSDIQDRVDIKEEEWKSFIAMFGIGASYNKVPQNFHEVRKYPVVVFPSDGILLWDMSNALDQIFDRFESEVKQDQRIWEKYQKHRGECLEDQIFRKLSEVFPTDAIYRTVDYPDPNQPNGSAEVDIVVYWEPFILFFEAKAGSLHFKSQIGDVKRLRNDLKKNLEVAFDQAKRTSEYYESTDKPTFIERATRRQVPIQKPKIVKSFLCTVTLERFGQMASKLAALAPLGLFTESEYPWAVVMSDLEIIAEFVENPDVLLHYIERRLEVQKHDIHFEADELDFLGAYLKNRLSLKQFLENPEETPSFVLLSGFSSDIDEYYGAFGSEKGEPLRIDLPDEIKKILAELRDRKDDTSARHLAFLLLDLPYDHLRAIADSFREMWQQEPKPGQFRRCTVNYEDVAISIMSARNLPKKLIYDRTVFRALAEKYRFKTSKGICFGINLSDPSKYFFSMHYAEGAWEFDPKMERALENEPPTSYDRKTLPGRNDPCFCGSGKKFKKCCKDKIT